MHLAEEWALSHLMSNPRLLTAWCWREQGFPAFSPSTPLPSDSNGLHEELLLGFDVGQDCAHRVLSMAVKRKPAEDGVASVWDIVLQARLGKEFTACSCVVPWATEFHGLLNMHVRTFCSCASHCTMGHEKPIHDFSAAVCQAVS